MPKRVISKEPLFNFIDIHISDIEKHPNALQDMLFNRSFEGMIIREVLPKETVELVVSRLENNEGGMSGILDSKFAEAIKGAYTLGENIVFSDPGLQQYFDYAAIFREKCRTLFEGKLDFEALMESVLSSLSGGLSVQVPNGPQGQSYIPATIRKVPTDHEFPIHVGNDFLNSPQSEHLRTLVDVTDQLSFFIPVALPEAGGELVIYGLEWDGEELVFEDTNSKNGYGSRLYQQSHQVFDQQYGSMTFKPNIGDMMLFDGGRFYHCIVPTIGDRTRITIGGFLSFSKEHDAIYYWS
ncbi:MULTISPECIES: 2OG-Fe(II)-dependent halogenase WelO5 family protein [Nostoc]|uniref:Uncharacterized protein n=2 Tax=Nostoc TaxID=1177 RepID=A0ABR8I122_9NOSO|nr:MULTISPECIES: hypothetical protein [Nostoc]MBD2561916.1 hypothetical protein [Nostoc linckia FACHB-391]MBD2644924.1 hypothetical protein [Nostoc foliaceum FACHB-393]